MNFIDATIFSIKESDYRIHFWYMSEGDAINIMNNSNLNEKRGVLSIFLLCIKNKWYNVLSNKQRCDTKQIERLL